QGGAPVIDVRRVSHTYLDGAPKVLDDVAVTFPPGAVTALVGASGAGESARHRAMGRRLTPGAGPVLLHRREVATAAPTAVAKRMAVLRQDNRIAARLTVVDLVRFGRFPYSAGRLTAEDHRIVEQSLDYVDMMGMRDCFLD